MNNLVATQLALLSTESKDIFLFLVDDELLKGLYLFFFFCATSSSLMIFLCILNARMWGRETGEF